MQKFKHIHRNAFSMLELVFVIVILGIVSSIGAEVIAKVYDSYIIERATHRSSLKTELAVTQIANRLAYAIPGTIIGGKSGGTFADIENLDASNYDILEWIGYDNDSFSAYAKPGWSGFADIGVEATGTSSSKLSTPGSDLDKTGTIIQSLGGSGISDAAILFPGTFTVNNIGYNSNTSGIIPVTGATGETLTVALTGKTVVEHYKLTWSAYAIVPSSPHADGTVDLSLYYNFQPWLGEAYTDGKNMILIKNVSVFKFVGSPNTIRFKICQQEKISNSYKITTCKEKAVIR